jgi:hypothetical protein
MMLITHTIGTLNKLAAKLDSIWSDIQYSCPVTTVKRTWQAIDSALNALHYDAYRKTAAPSTDSTTDDTAIHSDNTNSSTSDKSIQCTNTDEQQVMWYIRVWTCVVTSLPTSLSVGVIAAVSCIAALSSDTPTCQYCNIGVTSSNGGSNTGKCRLPVYNRHNKYK